MNNKNLSIDQLMYELSDSINGRLTASHHDKDDTEFKFHFTSLNPNDPECIRKIALVDQYELDYLRHRADFACNLLQKMYEELFGNYVIQGSCSTLDAYEYMVKSLILEHRLKELKKTTNIWSNVKIKIKKILNIE